MKREHFNFHLLFYSGVTSEFVSKHCCYETQGPNLLAEVELQLHMGGIILDIRR